MTSTTRKRRPISIYDYPEHLNPFSECHLNIPYVPDKRKIIVDKIRKNGTWSSKITKRLNRSVSWIEKSWLQVDNSPRRVYESRICNDLHNNALYAKQSQVHNESMTRRESCSDVRHEIEATPHEYISNGNSLEKSKSVEHLNKCDTRRRKKRPAPLPPSAVRTSVTETGIVENSDQEKVTNGECETEEKPQNETSVSHEDETNTTESSNEIPTEDHNSPDVPSEKPITEVDESKLSDQIKIIRIEIDIDDERQSKLNTSCENDTAPAESDEKQDKKLDVQLDEIQGKMIDMKLEENQEKQVDAQLDENANISLVKNENENCDMKTNRKTTSLTADNEIHV